MSLYSVKKYQPKNKNLWNNFVAEAKNATFLFHRDFMDYHQDRFHDASLMVFKEDKLVALFPANQVGSTIYSHQGLTYGGLIYKSNLKLKGVLKCFQSILENYQTEGFTDMELKLIPNIYNQLPSDELIYLLFILDAKLTRRDALAVVSQNNNISFSKDRKEGVKRAKKHNLKIKSNDSFDSFWNVILIPNLQKKHAAKPVHSLNEIKLLKQRFPDNIKQFNVYHNDILVAGTTIFISDNVAHSQYISADDNKNTLGSLDFLHNYLIQDVFKDKLYFDFGISNENNGKNVNSGLQYWKEGFGARTVVQDFYKIAINNYNKLSTVML